MEVFRLIYAGHFVLGIFVAIQLTPYPFTVLSLISDLEITIRKSFVATSISILAVLWYCVWYGSFQFAVRGNFPLVSIRFYAFLLATAYLGAGTLSAYLQGQSLTLLVRSFPLLPLLIAAILMLAVATAVILPREVRDWEFEKEKQMQERDKLLNRIYYSTREPMKEEDE